MQLALHKNIMQLHNSACTEKNIIRLLNSETYPTIPVSGADVRPSNSARPQVTGVEGVQGSPALRPGAAVGTV